LDIKSFDWRKYQRYVSPQAANDLSLFLEKLPQNAGKTVLLVAGIAWAAAAGIGLYTTIQVKSLTTLQAQLKETKALQPMVPKLKDVPVDSTAIKSFAQTLTETYPGLSVRQQGTSISMAAKTTASFGQFREAVGHVQNGGSGWRVSVDKLCVGRECPRDQLAALLKISKVSVDKPH
jgi:hypothetical protein